MNLEFWFEFGSTYSYPTAMRIKALAADRGLSVVWKPFLLGPIFREQGWMDSPFNLYPAKGQYMWRDLERICHTEKLPFRRPSTFPRNGLIAARVACWFSHAPWIDDFVQSIYRANFADDLDISNPSVIGRCLEYAGQDPANALSQAESPDAKTRLRDQTEKAKQRGIFGAPTFVVGNEMFWGNDRLEQALAWCSLDKSA